MTKEEIVSMPIEEYKNKFGKDPLEIIQSLENPTEDEIVQAMLDYANQVSYVRICLSGEIGRHKGTTVIESPLLSN